MNVQKIWLLLFVFSPLGAMNNQLTMLKENQTDNLVLVSLSSVCDQKSILFEIPGETRHIVLKKYMDSGEPLFLSEQSRLLYYKINSEQRLLLKYLNSVVIEHLFDAGKGNSIVVPVTQKSFLLIKNIHPLIKEDLAKAATTQGVQIILSSVFDDILKQNKQ